MLGLFFPVYYIVLSVRLRNAEDCDLNGFWVLPNPPEAHKSHKGSSEKAGQIPSSEEEVLNPELCLNTMDVTY